jgi:hypothetical protein
VLRRFGVHWPLDVPALSAPVVELRCPAGTARGVRGDDAAHAGLSTRTCIVVIERAAGRDAMPGDDVLCKRWYGTVIVRKGARGFTAASTVFIFRRNRRRQRPRRT